MRYKIFCLIFFFSFISYSQELNTIKRQDFIGQKIKFLKDKDDTQYYSGFVKEKNAYTWIDYKELQGRVATFIKKEKDLYSLIMEDTKDTIYYRLYDFTNIPNNIGFISLLDSARYHYLNKIFINNEFQECKIISINFAESDGKKTIVFGPYNIIFTIDKDTSTMNVHFTETYAREGGYQYDFEKERVFENIFRFDNPFVPITKDNINDKFFTDYDKIDEITTYIHVNYSDKQRLKLGLENSIDYKHTNILTSIEKSKKFTKLKFCSNFYADNWLFHSYIKIKIGKISKQTKKVKSWSRVLQNGNIAETNCYTSSSDLEIIKLIAEHYKDDIMIRFLGKVEYYDITLSMATKLAIKETYELYQLLK